jgi:CRISPR/Cas system-associated endonuclease Cas1
VNSDGGSLSIYNAYLNYATQSTNNRTGRNPSYHGQGEKRCADAIPVISEYQKRKQEKITRPFINEQMEIGLVFHIQAMLMARYLRGDIEFYPPFIGK